MKLGIGLPNTLGYELDRRLFLEWARLADEAGFYVAGTIDKPNFDSWDPLVSLAAAATVTERILLATTILNLPNRNEVLIAKQAAGWRGGDQKSCCRPVRRRRPVRQRSRSGAPVARGR